MGYSQEKFWFIYKVQEYLFSFSKRKEKLIKGANILYAGLGYKFWTLTIFQLFSTSIIVYFRDQRKISCTYVNFSYGLGGRGVDKQKKSAVDDRNQYSGHVVWKRTWPRNNRTRGCRRFFLLLPYSASKNFRIHTSPLGN